MLQACGKTEMTFPISVPCEELWTGLDSMSKGILLDTDVIVDFLRGYPDAIVFINNNYDSILLSSIVVAELYAGVKGSSELEILDDFISICQIVPVTEAIARIGGFHKRDYSGSHGIGLADAIIAATAQIIDVELKTLNVRHYPMLRNLKPPYHKV